MKKNLLPAILLLCLTSTVQAQDYINLQPVALSTKTKPVPTQTGLTNALLNNSKTDQTFATNKAATAEANAKQYAFTSAGYAQANSKKYTDSVVWVMAIKLADSIITARLNSLDSLSNGRGIRFTKKPGVTLIEGQYYFDTLTGKMERAW